MGYKWNLTTEDVPLMMKTMTNNLREAWVGSTFTGVMYLLSMVSGILADRLGIRTVGLIGGLLALVGLLYDHYGNYNLAFHVAGIPLFVGAAIMVFIPHSMVSGILADRLGIRTVGLIGGLLALVGMLCSAFVQNILLLYLTYGVIMGTGFSLAYTPSLAILGHYFKRRIGLANGLVNFGVFLGMCDGTVVCMFGPIAFDLVGPVDSTQALGFVFGLLALPASLGPPLAAPPYEFVCV
nr:hypothetical protein BaRGS_020540 [Batillaria attramentaria]